MALFRSRIRVLLVAGAVTMLPVATIPAASVATGSTAPGADSSGRAAAPVTVARGLDNPRMLHFGRNGGLLVAEAGAGGRGPCLTGPEGEVCFGLTGAISLIRNGHKIRVVRRLPSLAARNGTAAEGPADVVPLGPRRLAFTIGLASDPDVRAGLPAKGRFMATVSSARLRRAGMPGKLRLLHDVGAFEKQDNPDGGAIDTNPTGLARQGKAFVVTDAGGNDLVRLGGQGGNVLATFPERSFKGSASFQAVPTSVVKGPDGAWYVSQLTGAPFPKGAAQIWRVVAGKAPTVYARGLTNVTDLAFHKRQLYAVQLTDQGLTSGGPPMGSLRRVDRGTRRHPAVVKGLPAPYGVAFRRGMAYVTVCSVCANTGRVVRVPLR